MPVSPWHERREAEAAAAAELQEEAERYAAAAPGFTLNPLVAAQADKRDGKPLGACHICRSRVSVYHCHGTLVVERPESEHEDWWIACDNANCSRAYGEGYFQVAPDWVC